MNNLILGFITAFSLIAAIGAQNAHVLNVGLRRQNWLLVILICFFCDFILINVGIWGVGEIVAKNHLLKLIIAVCGIAFLLWYAFNFFKSAYLGINNLATSNDVPTKKLVITTLAVTLLNPHVYIDTVVLIGGISSTLPSHLSKIYFMLGALSASLAWFFSLGALAIILAPAFKKTVSWRILNSINGVFMLYIAWHLSKFITATI